MNLWGYESQGNDSRNEFSNQPVSALNQLKVRLNQRDKYAITFMFNTDTKFCVKRLRDKTRRSKKRLHCLGHNPEATLCGCPTTNTAPPPRERERESLSRHQTGSTLSTHYSLLEVWKKRWERVLNHQTVHTTQSKAAQFDDFIYFHQKWHWQKCHTNMDQPAIKYHIHKAC